MSDAQINAMLQAAYLAGFNASGEGWNGEYPFSDKNLNPADDDDWVDVRDNAIGALIAAMEGADK